jgi:hypothetical protein
MVKAPTEAGHTLVFAGTTLEKYLNISVDQGNISVDPPGREAHPGPIPDG